jgi:hypothetical protein
MTKRKPGAPRGCNPNSQETRRPWLVDGMSRRSWFRKQAAKRAANGEPPAQRFGRTKQPEAPP